MNHDRMQSKTWITARQRIVAGARRHFFARGFRGVTMDELAQELGMSKKTLYAHFPAKKALIEAVLQDKFATLEEELGQIATEGRSDVLGALHLYLACLGRHTQEIEPPFLRDIQREAPEMFRIVEERRHELIQRYFGRLLKEGRRAGIIRNDISDRLVIEILLSAVHAIMNPPRMAELDLTPKSGFIAIIRVILEGVLTEQGRGRP